MTRTGRDSTDTIKKMEYSVYILKSLNNSSYYIGATNNLGKRLVQHNKGYSKSTKPKRPWKIVYKEEFSDLREARQREKYIKSRKKRKFIEKLIYTKPL